MLIRDQLIGKMRSLPADKLEAVAAFVEHLEADGRINQAWQNTAWENI